MICELIPEEALDIATGREYNLANMVRTLLKKRTELPEIDFTVQVWKEGAAYVSYAPELDVSSCGDSVVEARRRLREAVSLFLEECSRRGTLDAILAESGFAKRGRSYRPRRIIARAKVRLAVPLAS
jgi:predicted RNase H-like HicB family nuclease